MGFIHFGCWNQGFCNMEQPNNGMSIVMNTLLNIESPDFYIVAGDNYYPKKIKYANKKKKKIFNEKNFRSGMDCLKQLTEKAPVFMLMGNHDLEPKISLYNSNELVDINNSPSQKNKIDECTIIKKELIYAKDFNIYEHSVVIHSSKTICLFINSVLYSDDLIKQEDLVCLKKFKPQYSEFTTLEKIINYEEQQLLNILNELINYFSEIDFTIKNVVISGHHPIVTRRIKKGIDVYSPLNMKGQIFLNKIFSKIPNTNKYYLCADTHQYQKSLIKLGDNIITQHVVGTGGTDCDNENINPNIQYISINDILEYKLLETNKSFGFLYCDKDNDNISCTFIPVASCDSFLQKTKQGSGRKTIKNKKYNKRKKKKNKKTKSRKISKKNN